MRISGLMPCIMVAAALAAPVPAHAQLGGLIKKKVKETIVQQVGGTNPAATTATPRTGLRFNEHLLEITPDLLDRLEKGLAAEQVVRQDVERQIGKVLNRDDYEACEAAVLQGPEGQKLYEATRNLTNGDTTYEHIQKASLELQRRMEQVVEPKCGLEPRKAEAIRTQNSARVGAAAPDASGLTRVQLSLLKERILPLCAAAQAVAAAAGEVRIPAGTQTSTNPIYFVYTPNEVSAVQPRCTKLASALRAAL